MLDYTGHPLVDVGIATIVAFADKDTPDELTESDLEAIADYMAQNYPVDPLRSYLTTVFMNSGFTNFAYFKQPDKQALYGDRVLRAFRAETPVQLEVDPLMGLPVADVSFDVKGELEPGRAFLQHVPFQTGEGQVNFHPYGAAGLPISGLALLTIQAFVLGSAKCSRKPLIVHSDNPEIILYFARTFLQGNRRAISLAQQAKSNKLENLPRGRATLLIETLLDALQRQGKIQKGESPFSITAYHINSGKVPSLDIYYLPSQIISFLQIMLSPDYITTWEQLVGGAWIKPKSKRGQVEGSSDTEPYHNYLYNDLFNLVEDLKTYAPHFIRTYFLRNAYKFASEGETGPHDTNLARQEAHLNYWKLTELFLKEILHMEKERISQIRALGDHLAEYIFSENDKFLFTNFRNQNPHQFRSILLRANLAHVKHGNPPLIPFDPYIEVFEVAEGDFRPDWRLARDLVLIRMIERLYELGWLGKNSDAIPEILEDDAETPTT